MWQKKKYIAFSSFQQQPIPLKLIVFDTQKKFVWSWKFQTTFRDTKNQFKLRNSGEIRTAVKCLTKTFFDNNFIQWYSLPICCQWVLRCNIQSVFKTTCIKTRFFAICMLLKRLIFITILEFTASKQRGKSYNLLAWHD